MPFRFWPAPEEDDSDDDESTSFRFWHKSDPRYGGAVAQSDQLRAMISETAKTSPLIFFCSDSEDGTRNVCVGTASNLESLGFSLNVAQAALRFHADILDKVMQELLEDGE